MKYYINNRGTGKTTYCIIESSLTGYPIIVSTRSQADYVKEIAQGLGLGSKVTVFTVGEYLTKPAYWNRYEKIIIDELEQVGLKSPFFWRLFVREFGSPDSLIHLATNTLGVKESKNGKQSTNR